jgi:hypothetical protein
MKTALARRNAWMRQLKRLRDERNRRVEDEPEGMFKNADHQADISNRPNRDHILPKHQAEFLNRRRIA